MASVIHCPELGDLRTQDSTCHRHFQKALVVLLCHVFDLRLQHLDLFGGQFEAIELVEYLRRPQHLPLEVLALEQLPSV